MILEVRLKTAYVYQKGGSSPGTKRLIIHACFLMKSAFPLYRILCQKIWADGPYSDCRHDGTVPCFGTRLQPLFAALES